MKVIYYSNNVKVIDSYKIDNNKDIKDSIKIILENDLCPQQVKDRTVISLYREWKAHNRLYKFNLFRSHTKDVDLGYEPWYRRLCFFFLAW